jgi:hypothetical protein|tara:strand:+ start:1688 stop:1978 length:291 start_codon:yes stop_codon:yes gene_type:complete
MKLAKSQLKQIIKEELSKTLNEVDYAKLGLVQDVVYAAGDQNVDKFEELLVQLGFDVDPQFTNDQIIKIKSILDDMSLDGGFDKATIYVKQLIGME